MDVSKLDLHEPLKRPTLSLLTAILLGVAVTWIPAGRDTPSKLCH